MVSGKDVIMREIGRQGEGYRRSFRGRFDRCGGLAGISHR